MGKGRNTCNIYNVRVTIGIFLFFIGAWKKKTKTKQECSCLENPRDGGAWWAAVHGVAQSQTRLKRLSSSSSSAEK